MDGSYYRRLREKSTGTTGLEPLPLVLTQFAVLEAWQSPHTYYHTCKIMFLKVFIAQPIKSVSTHFIKIMFVIDTSGTVDQGFSTFDADFQNISEDHFPK